MEVLNDLVIRPAQREDLPAIFDLMAAYDMVGNFTAENCVIAEKNDNLIGFARVEVAETVPYVRPIVVARQNQGRGVGKALLQHILCSCSDLRVVSRGSVIGFYTQMGFKSADWDEIHLAFKNECAACPDLKNCRPVPMRSLSASVIADHP